MRFVHVFRFNPRSRCNIDLRVRYVHPAKFWVACCLLLADISRSIYTCVKVRSGTWYGSYLVPRYMYVRISYQVCTYLRRFDHGWHTLAHEELNKMRMADSHREVHVFRCKLASCKCRAPMVHRKKRTPYVWTKWKGRRERAVCRQTLRASHHQQYFYRPSADFDFFVRFENRELYVCMLDDMLAGANSVSLPAMPRSDRRVVALLLVARVDCAVLYRAVLAVLAVLRC